MTASHSLALFKTPVTQGGFSTDSAFPPRADHRLLKPVTPRLSPNSLTQSLPDTEGTLLLGLACLALPAVGYSLWQLSHLMFGDLLPHAIRAFAP